jgi:phosphoglycolate phosphatase
MKNRLPSSIIFDLDGTLINTVPDVRLALNHALNNYGHAPLEIEELHPYIGKGAKYMLSSAFARYDHVLSRGELETVLDQYLIYYLEHPVVETKIYPDVELVLGDLARAGIQLGICTNKPGVVTRVVLEALNMTRFFSGIVCGDETTYPKPDAKHLFAVLAKLSTTDQQTVLVGDSSVDQLCAKNAAIPFIGVSYGYDLDKDATGTLVHHFNELPAAVEQLYSGEVT